MFVRMREVSIEATRECMMGGTAEWVENGGIKELTHVVALAQCLCIRQFREEIETKDPLIIINPSQVCDVIPEIVLHMHMQI